MINIYSTISYSEETYPEGTFWTEISSDAYGDPYYVPQIIAFNFPELDEADRISLSLTQELTIKIPDLDQEYFDNSALPPWRQ